jgi:hypothetical protein
LEALRDKYLRFLNNLPNVVKRTTKSQIVFSVNGKRFCWVWINGIKIQIFPRLGDKDTGKRYIKHEEGKTLIIERTTEETGAEYLDIGARLEWIWSYPGFTIDTIPFEEGCNLIRQAYNLAKKRK